LSPSFSSADFLHSSTIARLTQIRVEDPDRALRAAKHRKRRERLAPDGRLNILAADHPARRVTAIGSAPIAMTNRHDYLARIVRVLMSELVDGVMATMDILEDLLALHDLTRESGGPAFLDEKLLIVSLNRGGLAQSVWELDDPITGFAPANSVQWNLDGAKFLLRIADGEPASLKTMLAASAAITELNALRLPMFLEPLPVVKSENGYNVVKTAEALSKIVGVASALGDSSRYLWLKLPYCEGYEAVASATTLPILLLGGESAGEPRAFLTQVAQGIAAGANVRGAMVGRNVIYPGKDDPLAAGEAVGQIVHRDCDVEQALAAAAKITGRDMDWLSHHFAHSGPGTVSNEMKEAR
jgi:DhnA family fructose-bisphosphate aldolase class Ia